MKIWAATVLLVFVIQSGSAQSPGTAPGGQPPPPPSSPPMSGPPKPSPPTPAPPMSMPPMSMPPKAGPPQSQPPSSVPSSPSPSGSSTAASSSSSSSGSSGISDLDILTFAYNLECLEGNFYNCAAFGTALSSSITGGGPAPSSCKKANLSSNVGTYAAELAREEAAHVSLLYNAIKSAGGNPVCPYVNIDTAFEAAAEAAFNQPGTPLQPTFDPYANDIFFLHGAFLFEDLGASAYLGAVGLLSSASTRSTAAQIGNTESYHASLDRTLLYQVLTTTAAYGQTVQQITAAIVTVLNKLSGSPQLKYDLTNAQGASISNVDSNALVPVATPQQVLKVVTLGAANGSGGGFFPNNLVGNVKN